MNENLFMGYGDYLITDGYNIETYMILCEISSPNIY